MVAFADLRVASGLGMPDLFLFPEPYNLVIIIEGLVLLAFL